MEFVTLNNGVKMPVLGYGVYQVTPEECEQCVADAVRAGYRSVDTAQAYANEEGVGNAVAKCGVPRGELFITTKVWITNAGYEKAKASKSWGPFAEGKNDMFTNPVLTEIGRKYHKSAAQTALRFLIQSGVVVIPKSVRKERMEENIKVFDFRLTEEEMQRIESLDGGESLFFSHYDPKTVEWIVSLA